MAITYEINPSPQLLDQYYHMRDKYFKRDLGISEFNGSEDSDDRAGRILIAHKDGECIAGARIVSSAPMLQQLEECGLTVDDCCMWERFVMHPGSRQLALGRDFCSALIEVSRNMNFSHAMVLSTLRISRLYRMCHSGLGVEFNIRRAAPECAKGAFAKLDHYLSVAHLKRSERRAEPRINQYVPVMSAPLQAVA